MRENRIYKFSGYLTEIPGFFQAFSRSDKFQVYSRFSRLLRTLYLLKAISFSLPHICNILVNWEGETKEPVLKYQSMWAEHERQWGALNAQGISRTISPLCFCSATSRYAHVGFILGLQICKLIKTYIWGLQFWLTKSARFAGTMTSRLTSGIHTTLGLQIWNIYHPYYFTAADLPTIQQVNRRSAVGPDLVLQICSPNWPGNTGPQELWFPGVHLLFIL